MFAGQPQPSSVNYDRIDTPAQPVARASEIRAITVVLTLDGSKYEGTPPRPGSFTWGQRLARNVGLGTLVGFGAAYATGFGLAVVVGFGVGAAISSADKRA